MTDQPAKPLAALAADYRVHLGRQAGLCDRLEHVADGLPAQCNVQECLYLAQSLAPTVKTAHRFEEDEVFPVLRHRAAARPRDLPATLERLKTEHMGDEDFADELTLSLRDYATGRGPVSAETLSWMLRAFFEAMRRHIAFETEHVLPLLEQGGVNGA